MKCKDNWLAWGRGAEKRSPKPGSRCGALHILSYVLVLYRYIAPRMNPASRWKACWACSASTWRRQFRRGCAVVLMAFLEVSVVASERSSVSFGGRGRLLWSSGSSATPSALPRARRAALHFAPLRPCARPGRTRPQGRFCMGSNRGKRRPFSSWKLGQLKKVER